MACTAPEPRRSAITPWRRGAPPRAASPNSGLAARVRPGERTGRHTWLRGRAAVRRCVDDARLGRRHDPIRRCTRCRRTTADARLESHEDRRQRCRLVEHRDDHVGHDLRLPPDHGRRILADRNVSTTLRRARRPGRVALRSSRREGPRHGRLSEGFARSAVHGAVRPGPVGRSISTPGSSSPSAWSPAAGPTCGGSRRTKNGRRSAATRTPRRRSSPATGVGRPTPRPCRTTMAARSCCSSSRCGPSPRRSSRCGRCGSGEAEAPAGRPASAARTRTLTEYHGWTGDVMRRVSRFVLKFGGDPELAQAT